MLRNYTIRLVTALCLTIFLTWVSYKLIINSDRKYFHVIGNNEFVLLEDTTTYDMLLLGSSRMKNNVNPQIVDSITSLNTYNAGCSGANAVEVNTILQSYLLQHKPPRYIVVALDLFSLESDKHLQYYPTYITCNDSPPIEKALRDEGVPTMLYKLMPFFKVVELNDYYKGVVVKAFMGKTDIEKGDFFYKGFVSNTDQILGGDNMGPQVAFGITDKGIEAVGDIVNTCKEHNINLIFTYAPEYKRLNIKSSLNADRIFEVYDSIAVANNIPFYHDELLDINTERQLFANNGHLNRNGAVVYSVIFSKELMANRIISAGKEKF